MSLFNNDKSQKFGMQCFALYDAAAEAFSPPMFFQSKGIAIRALGDAARGGDKNITAHPADFKLFYLGTYDPKSASFDLVKSPEPLVLASEAKGE